jgi:AraC-like DNA-binding protein
MVLSHQHFDLNGKVILERVVFKTPFMNQLSMDHEACLFYNITGEMQLYSSLNKDYVSENECVIMKCGQYFSTHPLNVNDTPSDVIGIHFHPEILKQVFDNNLSKYFSAKERQKDRREINKVKVNTILENYIQGLLFLFENPTLVTDELIKIKLKELLLLLLNTSSKEAEKIRGIISDIFNPVQASFKEIIQTHCYNNITTEQLAFLCNMSLSTFKRRFVETYQENPATYIRKKKLEKAAHLLKTSKESIASICYDVGFTDTSNFTKIFTAHFQTTPRKYRMQFS